MEAVIVACPHCRRDLKLNDRSKLGRRVKCPGCGEQIVLQEKPLDDEPIVTLLEESPPLDLPKLERGESYRAKRQRNRLRSRLLWGGLSVVAIAGLVGLGIWITSSGSEDDREQAAINVGDEGGQAGEGERRIDGSVDPADEREMRQRELDENPELVDEFNPTDGEPITLEMMPSGINAVLHLRPREIWSSDVEMQTLRASLTEGVVNWIDTFIKTNCRRDPIEIEEALFGMFLGARGNEPQMAVVVQLAEDAKRSELIEEFRGNPIFEAEGLRIVGSEEYTYILLGQRTIGICPTSLAEINAESQPQEVMDWVNLPNPNCSDGLLNLLPFTDRERLCTLVFDVEAVRRHEEELFPADAKLAFQSVLDWFGDEVETVAWSLHVDKENLHSQMHLRTSSITTPSRLRATMRSRLEEAPRDMWALTEMMEPARVGFRQIIGRFPAMIEAFRWSTAINLLDYGDRNIRLTTILPAKAAPNLALGVMLTWKESTTTDFTASPTVVASNDDEPEMTLEQKLKLDVDAEFNRQELESALNYVGTTIGATIYIDGDALMDAGITRNMRQTFTLGVVPAEVVLARICADLKLVICIDHEANQIRLTTEKFATAEGREIYALPEVPE